MPEHVDPNTPHEDGPPLVFRGYRRHRKQSRWGSWSLAFPPLAVLWSVFWLLIVNQQREVEPSTGVSLAGWALVIGAGLILLAGTLLASRGVADTYYKRGSAALALAINLVLFVGLIVAMGLRLFAGSIG
ncbi:MAG: hypothetical protein WD768_13025 [Phycisphaeraceae bacterium]